MRLTPVLLAATLVFALSLKTNAAEYLQILNSYVSMKLHLDPNPKQGQMVGAAWIRIRNNGTSDLREVPFILNPGLQVTKVAGTKNTPLSETSAITPIAGYEFLETTAGIITLAAPVPAGKETEIIIQYRGKLENLSWTGLDHVHETLNTDFTIIRVDSFAYPVLAAPNKSAIAKANNQPPYFQTTTIELNDGYVIAGNLHVNQTEVKGANVSYNLKYDVQTAPMILPIARYETLSSGPVTLYYLNGQNAAATSLLNSISPKLQRLQSLIGAPGKSKINVTMVPDGYGSKGTTGLIMLEQSNYTPQGFNTATGDALLGLWIKDGYPAGNWKNSFSKVISNTIGGKDNTAFKAEAFGAVQAMLKGNAATGKSTIVKFGENGWSREAETLTTFVLAGLHDIMGEEAFFALVRTMRTELRGAAADNETLAEFLSKKTPHKKAKKFAKNWLKGKKAGKEMKKASNFADVMKRYK